MTPSSTMHGLHPTALATPRPSVGVLGSRSVARLISGVVVAGLGLALAGCSRADSPVEAAPHTKAPGPAASASQPTSAPTIAKKDAAMPTPLTLALTRSGNQLHAVYRYENPTDHVQYIADGLISQIGNDTFRYSRGTDYQAQGADTIELLIGMLAPGMPDATPPQPAYLPVAAKSTFEGKRDIPLPFTEIDPSTRSAKPMKEPPNAVLSVLLYDGEPTWMTVKGKDGPLKIAKEPATTTLTSAPIAIPTK